jgi:hypothetical protein
MLNTKNCGVLCVPEMILYIAYIKPENPTFLRIYQHMTFSARQKREKIKTITKCTISGVL